MGFILRMLRSFFQIYERIKNKLISKKLCWRLRNEKILKNFDRKYVEIFKNKKRIRDIFNDPNWEISEIVLSYQDQSDSHFVIKFKRLKGFLRNHTLYFLIVYKYKKIWIRCKR